MTLVWMLKTHSIVSGKECDSLNDGWYNWMALLKISDRYMMNLMEFIFFESFLLLLVNSFKLYPTQPCLTNTPFISASHCLRPDLQILKFRSHNEESVWYWP